MKGGGADVWAGEVRWQQMIVRVTRVQCSILGYSGFQPGYSGSALTWRFQMRIRTFWKLTQIKF